MPDTLAGPILSLFQGLIAAFLFLRSKGRKLIHLLLLWFSVLGFNNFLGYLMTGPLFNNGDIGKVYLLLDFPIVYQIIVAIIGAMALLYIAFRMTKPFLEFCSNPEWIQDGKSRKNFSLIILIVPWLIGSSIITFLYLPIIAIISIIYPIMSGMVFIYPWQNAEGIKTLEKSGNTELAKLSIPTLGLLVFLRVIFKWVLAPGIIF